jgi:hypothetical protein
MVVLRADASDQELLSVADRWVDCLAEQDYSAAMALTAHDEYYGWTPDLIRGVIEGYGLPDPHPRGPFRVTARADARKGPEPRRVVERARDADVLGRVEVDLPLNGAWSDLTATFAIRRCPGGIALVLHEIHVF